MNIGNQVNLHGVGETVIDSHPEVKVPICLSHLRNQQAVAKCLQQQMEYIKGVNKSRYFQDLFRDNPQVYTRFLNVLTTMGETLTTEVEKVVAEWSTKLTDQLEALFREVDRINNDPRDKYARIFRGQVQPFVLTKLEQLQNSYEAALNSGARQADFMPLQSVRTTKAKQVEDLDPSEPSVEDIHIQEVTFTFASSRVPRPVVVHNVALL